MKILMLTYEITGTGGNYIRSSSIARALVSMGHKVILLSANNKPSLSLQSFTSKGVDVLEVADFMPKRFRHDGFSPMQVINRIIYIQSNQFDIIHGFGHRPSVSIPSMFKSNYSHIPYVADWCDLWGWDGIATLRGGVLGSIEGAIDTLSEKFVYQKADATTVICEDLFQRMKKIGKKTSELLILPPGSNTDIITPLLKHKARAKLGLSFQAHVAVYISNTSYDQNFLEEVLIRLFKTDKNSILLLAGTHMSALMNKIKNNGYLNRVVYKGFVPQEQIKDILACGDVMLLPYKNTSINRGRYPNKIGDYLAAGRPTVANPTGDLKKLFERAKIGILASEDPQDFAQNVIRLFNDKDEQNRLGFNSRRVATTEFSWISRAKLLSDFYERTLFSYKSKTTPKFLAAKTYPLK